MTACSCSSNWSNWNSCLFMQDWPLLPCPTAALNYIMITFQLELSSMNGTMLASHVHCSWHFQMLLLQTPHNMLFAMVSQSLSYWLVELEEVTETYLLHNPHNLFASKWLKEWSCCIINIWDSFIHTISIRRKTSTCCSKISLVHVCVFRVIPHGSEADENSHGISRTELPRKSFLPVAVLHHHMLCKSPCNLTAAK